MTEKKIVQETQIQSQATEAIAQEQLLSTLQSILDNDTNSTWTNPYIHQKIVDVTTSTALKY